MKNHKNELLRGLWEGGRAVECFSVQSLINSVLLSLHKDCADRPSSGSLRLEGHPLRRPVCTWVLLRVGVPFDV